MFDFGVGLGNIQHVTDFLSRACFAFHQGYHRASNRSTHLHDPPRVTIIDTYSSAHHSCLAHSLGVQRRHIPFATIERTFFRLKTAWRTDKVRYYLLERDCLFVMSQSRYGIRHRCRYVACASEPLTIASCTSTTVKGACCKQITT